MKNEFIVTYYVSSECVGRKTEVIINAKNKLVCFKQK